MAVPVIFGLAGGPASGRSVEKVPNLVTLVTAVEIGVADGSCVGRLTCVGDSNDPALRFDSGFANRGNAAFEILGEPDGPADRKAMQCLSWATDGVCAERAEVGRLIFHAEHGHFHFKDFARYELRRLRPDMTADMTRRGLVVDGGKISFCIVDQEQDTEASTGASSPSPHYRYGACETGILMGLSPGYRDIYGAGTPGQYLPLKGIKDGRYALVVTADPDGRLTEQRRSDNVSVTGIRLFNDTEDVEVLCQNEPGSKRCRPTVM